MRVQDADDVGAVVHRDLRAVVDRRVDVRVVGVVVLAADGEGRRRRSAPTRAAATSSCVDSGFDAHSTTSAPPAFSVRIRLAVSVVTCRQAEMRRPSSGFSRSKRSRMAASTGIWRSAHSMRRTPSSASAILDVVAYAPVASRAVESLSRSLPVRSADCGQCRAPRPARRPARRYPRQRAPSSVLRRSMSYGSTPAASAA